MRGRLIAIALLLTSTANAQMIGVGYRNVFVASDGGGGTVTHEQACGYQDPNNAYPTSLTCTFPNPVVAGDLLFFSVQNAEGAPTFTISGETGATVNILESYGWGTGSISSGNYILSASGGETKITLNFSAGQYYPAVSFDEFHCSPTCSLDMAGTSSANHGTGTELSSGSITTISNNDLVIGYFGGSPTSTYTAGLGFTIDGYSVTGFGSGQEYFMQTTAGAITATATQSVSAPWMLGIVAFKP